MVKKTATCISTAMALILFFVWIISIRHSHVEDGGIALIAQGNNLVKAGDPTSLQKAVDTYKKAVETFHGMDDKKESHNEGLAYYNIARAYHALKQNDQAIYAGQRALPLLAGPDAKVDAADMYDNLGLYYIQTNQPDKAMVAYTHAEPLYQELGLPDKVKHVVYVEGALRYDQATAAAAKRDWPTARDSCIQAQQLYHQAGRQSAEADACHELGLIYTAMGEAAYAAEAQQQEQALRAGTHSEPHK